jgi:hypothetical protein
MERHRIESPPPAPVEHSSYSDSVPASDYGEEIKTSALEESSHDPTASDSQVAAQPEETAVKETKHDWM